MPAFSFYTDITPLDSNIHRKLRYQPVTDYSFAKKTQLAPLGTSEFFDCAVEFPIVFIRTPRGLVPVALFGARPDENTFISAKGKWDSSYRPMFIQRYPL